MLETILASPVLIAIASGAFGAIGGAMTARWTKAPDVQAVTNAAVENIIKHYSEALALQTAEVHQLRAEIGDLRTVIEKQAEEIAELNNHIIDLSAALERHGVAPPPRRKREAS